MERDISLVAKIKNQNEEEAHHDDDNDVQVKVSSLTIFTVSDFRARVCGGSVTTFFSSYDVGEAPV